MNVTNNIRTAFKELGERVHRTLHLQRGDVSRMETQRDNADQQNLPRLVTAGNVAVLIARLLPAL